jgi:hypothetical protein
MGKISPLKERPLPNPGDSLDRQIRRLTDEKMVEPLLFAGGFIFIALMEWMAYLAKWPRQPMALSIAAVLACAFAFYRIRSLRAHVKALELGRDGERMVGQYLEGLRAHGAQVFHDVPAEGFNLDHVVVSPHGIFVVETKTFTKPHGKARVVVEGDKLLVAGRVPDRDPIAQVAGASRWLRDLLESSTGKTWSVRGVVVFPRWFVEQRSPRGNVWVLEPKALPSFIEREPTYLSQSDLHLAAFHLSRYVRSELDAHSE